MNFYSFSSEVYGYHDCKKRTRFANNLERKKNDKTVYRYKINSKFLDARFDVFILCTFDLVFRKTLFFNNFMAIPKWKYVYKLYNCWIIASKFG